MSTEQLHAGVSVRSREGHKLGVLSRFVLDRDARRLTHIVIDTGILRSGTPLWEGGWGLSHDRVVPIGVLALSSEDAVDLTMSADEFRDLSVDYIEESFEQFYDVGPGKADLSDLGRFTLSVPGNPGAFLLRESMSKPSGSIDVREDMPVWRMNPHEKLGEVHRVLFDEATNNVTALVIRRGHIFSKEVVLPMSAVSEILPQAVRVDLDDGALKHLEEFS